MTPAVTDQVEVPSRRRRVTPLLLLAGGAVALSLALHLRDPHEPGSWGSCPWLLMTGTYCPGCGGLRAVSDLTRGSFAAAASANILVVAAVPACALLWVRSLRRRWTGVHSSWRPAVVSVNAAVVAVALLTFWVVRNLPFGSWLAP